MARDMKCQTAIHNISALVDGHLRGTELRELVQHLDRCLECALYSHQIRQLNSGLRALPVRTPPPELSTALRVMASHELARQDTRASLPALLAHWGRLVRLWMDTLMRPVALPFAGGLASAIVLFSMLVPTFATQEISTIKDVPTMLTTEAALESSLSMSFDQNVDDVMVDVLVDGEGRMLDYSILDGQQWTLDAAARRSIENTLLLTRFTPATMFGQPASGKLRISLRRSHVDVIG